MSLASPTDAHEYMRFMQTVTGFAAVNVSEVDSKFVFVAFGHTDLQLRGECREPLRIESRLVRKAVK